MCGFYGEVTQRMGEGAVEMTHDELLARLDEQIASSKAVGCDCLSCDNAKALRAVVELHMGGINNRCVSCLHGNKCETIQAIEKELG